MDATHHKAFQGHLVRSCYNAELTNGQDTTVEQFRMLLRECRQRIEDTALASDTLNRCMMPLVQARIDVLQTMMQRMQNDDQNSFKAEAGETQ